MVPPIGAAIENKAVEEYWEAWKDDYYIPFNEKSYKQYMEYEFILDKRYV